MFLSLVVLMLAQLDKMDRTKWLEQTISDEEKQNSIRTAC